MEKKYQVFVSSTFLDLIEERQNVIMALLELDCIPSGMELFPAADDDQWSVIKGIIDDCDYYLVVVGGRYGSVGPDGKSYTQMEYEYAVSKKKPVVGFLHKKPGSLPAEKTEETDEGRARLKQFRKLVEQRLCRFWTTPDDLGAAVTTSLTHLKKTRPARGWVRGDAPAASPAGMDKVNAELEVSFASVRKYLEWTVMSVLRGEAPLGAPDPRIEVRAEGLSVKVGRATLNIDYGRIESCEATDPDCVVALPANEFFDDECLKDKRSALGAYINAAFPDGLDEIREVICEKLKDLPSWEVEKTLGRLHKSYGIAQCLYLDNPLSSGRKIILVSVTTMRAGQGLASEPHYLFGAVRAINRVMKDNRLNELHLPLIGSGHGGLEKVMALFYLVLAIVELLSDTKPHGLHSINLVLYKAEGAAEAEVPREQVAQMLSLALSVFD